MDLRDLTGRFILTLAGRFQVTADIGRISFVNTLWCHSLIESLIEPGGGGGKQIESGIGADEIGPR